MKYKCPNCDWAGDEKEMLLACRQDEGDDEEICSLWICPACKTWHQLKDYQVIENGVPSGKN
jgi:rubredoxin